jgi:hypothetical protein
MFACCDQRRLEVLRRSGSANAIEFVEVLDRSAPAGVPRQQTLFVRLLRPGFTPATDQIRITGGERIPTVGITWAAVANALPSQAEPGLVDGVDELARTLVIRTAGNGDFSRYTLAIVAGAGSNTPPASFDPLLASITFSFKVECSTDFDCAAPLPCPPEPSLAPRIDYLAKDYQGFRRLMLDRLSLLAPGWTERSVADVGVAVVELLAFAADTLSYRQDVIANEAYLNTARQRISVRRHARLVDYYLHEGCNARAFVHFSVTRGASDQVLPPRTRLLTSAASVPTVMEPGSDEERRALEAGSLVFETAHAVTLREIHNQFSFYTWGDTGCCLPRGATSATLKGSFRSLSAGDFLVFQEMVSPTTFQPEDADRAHRHVVRLTRVVLDVDPSGRLFEATPVDAPAPITRIEWDASDALPFVLCVSVLAKPDLEISVALGNVVLVDHGATIHDEALAPLPTATPVYASSAHVVGECCHPVKPVPRPLRYRPALRQLPLTHGFDLGTLIDLAPNADEGWWSASAFRALDSRQAGPRIALIGKRNFLHDDWFPQRDLLASDDGATDFVVEVQDDGIARLRFGDGTLGRRPEDDTLFEATYRIGNGVAGNVGAAAIAHLVMTPAIAIDAVANPLPAFGGTDPEQVEAARRDAPYAFRTQQRAVTAADYAAVAERRADVQRAAASFRWTGSWHTVLVTADRLDGAAVDSSFEAGLRRHLEKFRMAGYDLEVDAPHYVALDVAVHLCVKPAHFRSDVVKSVGQVLSNALLPDGRRGAFHPDNFTFGQPVYLSRIIAAAQAVEGVESVRIDRFQRLYDGSPATLAAGVIPLGHLEIAQLDNNPNFPDRGRIAVTAGGGK